MQSIFIVFGQTWHTLIVRKNKRVFKKLWKICRHERRDRAVAVEMRMRDLSAVSATYLKLGCGKSPTKNNASAFSVSCQILFPEK